VEEKWMGKLKRRNVEDEKVLFLTISLNQKMKMKCWKAWEREYWTVSLRSLQILRRKKN
jgi:hypothetical protein